MNDSPSATPEQVAHYEGLAEGAEAMAAHQTTWEVAGYSCGVSQHRSQVNRDRMLTTWTVVGEVGLIGVGAEHHSEYMGGAAYDQACKDATQLATNVRREVRDAVHRALADQPEFGGRGVR